MAGKVNIRDVESLRRLRTSIAQFSDSSIDAIYAIDSQIEKKLSHLKSLESRFQKSIENLETKLAGANRSLALCESDISYDEDGYPVYPDCSFEISFRSSCLQELRNANNRFEFYQQQMAKLDMAIQSYQPPKTRFKQVLEFTKAAPATILKQLIDGAEDYLSTEPPSFHFGNREPQQLHDKANANGIIRDYSSQRSHLRVTSLAANYLFKNKAGIGQNFQNEFSKSSASTWFLGETGKDLCSVVKFNQSDSSNIVGTISDINVPPSLNEEGVGRHIVLNAESICRANGCNEISVWSSDENISFFQGLGYQIRAEVKGSGAEVYKPLEVNYLQLQGDAKADFSTISNSDFIKGQDLGIQEVNPLKIICPDEVKDENFWNQHGLDQNKYLELINLYDRCQNLLDKGKSLDEIRTEDYWVANAHDVFHGSEPICLQKVGDSYRIDIGGRHRVAAAQLYYLKTGKTIKVPCKVVSII